MKYCYDIGSLSGLEPATIEAIQDMATKLFTTQTEDLPGYIKELIDIVGVQMRNLKERQIFIAAIAVYFDAAFKHLCSVRKLRNSELYSFLKVVNHLPVLPSSAYYTQTLDILSKYFREDRQAVKLFDQLQMLHLFIEFGYYEGAQELQLKLQDQIQHAHPHFITLYQYCRFRHLNSSENLNQRMDLVLQTISNTFHQEGKESTIFMLFHWLSSLNWIKHSKLYMAVLYNLFEAIKGEHSLNSALLAYEIFELDSRLVSPEAKMELYNYLISYPASMLNSRQLRALHFFAGTYNGSRMESFRDSINSYKSSNYYLNKCWERMINVSKYIRTHCDASTFKTSVAYLEKSILQLSHYASMRNNCFVENLQASFDQIEQLSLQMSELSLTDSLTGLRNRRFQEINLPQLAAFAARHKTPVCFAMMDIDFFKTVNDIHSHAAGDAVLKQLGEMMRKEFRKSDIIIRYGGEEFLIVLFDSELQNAIKILDAFRRKIASYSFIYEDQLIQITVSIGISAEYFDNNLADRQIGDFIGHSDIAMYAAKASGRNSIRSYLAPAENPA
ncbi:MAG TPA: GGDEF domain-containing protein [Candidatus Cloacimonadota bacterium]|nr:GGDEF domain-containing protein [Candidatus Cloacimonadota bacterium]